MPDLDLTDIQGLVARGYVDLKAASYLLLTVDSPDLARAWLGRLIDQVTPAATRTAPVALNVAFTASGFSKLGLPASVWGSFSNEFTAGMTTPHRRRILGDVDAGAPEHWLWGGPNTSRLDLLLMLFARDAAELSQHHARLSGAFASGGISEQHTLDSVFDLGGKEHFGFADGISQPTVAGLSSRRDLPSNTVQPGEFILGYLNEYGRYTDRPLLHPRADPGHVLPLDAEGSGRADLGRNGSYVVFRQLRQDVRGFWRFVDRATHRTDGTGDPVMRTWLAAKMVGRWPSGAPLALAPASDDPRLATANDFTYQYADEFGLSCPIGAHVRRAHPRDSLDPEPGTERSVAVDRRHRLLRRGREYGPPVDDVLSDAPADDPDRGLYFICLAGNIARQFELIQHTWLNSPKFDGLYDEADPLVANHSPGTPNFSVPADPVRLRYTDLPRFVTVRGGAYFFLPGIRALKYLASLLP